MTHAGSTITYPPEMLPSPDADDDVEVIVCDEGGQRRTHPPQGRERTEHRMTDPIIEAAAWALQNALGNTLLPILNRHVASIVITAAAPLIRAAALEEAAKVAKRPVAWRVKDYADGWIIFQDEAAATCEAEQTGAIMQGLYVRDGS